jgi:hypothetical protein
MKVIFEKWEYFLSNAFPISERALFFKVLQTVIFYPYGETNIDTKVSMMLWRNDTDRGKLENSEINLS